MATSFKNVLSSGVGTTPNIVYRAAGNVRVTAIGISFSNQTNGFVTASVYLVDPAPQGTFQANTSTSSNPTKLANVNSFNNISVGAALSGDGIPSNTTVVSFDTVAKTITMNNSATATATNVTISFTGTTPVTAYYIKDVVIPPNQSLRVINGGERLVIGSSNSLVLQTSVDGSCDAIISLVEIV
jgi:hypothetical protein